MDAGWGLTRMIRCYRSGVILDLTTQGLISSRAASRTQEPSLVTLATDRMHSAAPLQLHSTIGSLFSSEVLPREKNKKAQGHGLRRPSRAHSIGTRDLHEVDSTRENGQKRMANTWTAVYSNLVRESLNFSSTRRIDRGSSPSSDLRRGQLQNFPDWRTRQARLHHAIILTRQI